LVSEWRASGLTAQEYATSRGVNARTLSWWKWKLRTRHEQTFLEVVVTAPAPPPPDLVVEFGELRVRVPSGFDALELRRLVSALC
jgi:hypothetical protein